MRPDEVTKLFDQQAAGYDQKWERLAAINDALHLLTSAALSGISESAHVLCVGAGTGAEILKLAQLHPGWTFTAVEPSRPMLEAFRAKAEGAGISARCELHCGYLDTLDAKKNFDAATAFLVSQFLQDREQRIAFFQEIADHLISGGILVSSDLATDLRSPEGERLLEIWFSLMSGNGISAEGVQQMRQAYSKDVAVVPPAEVEQLLSLGGFELPVPIFQAGMIRAWRSIRRSP